LSAELGMSVAVACELQSAAGDFVADRWQVAVELSVWGVAAPVCVHGHSKHFCVGAIQRLLLCLLCQSPALTAIE